MHQLEQAHASSDELVLVRHRRTGDLALSRMANEAAHGTMRQIGGKQGRVAAETQRVLSLAEGGVRETKNGVGGGQANMGAALETASDLEVKEGGA